MRHARAERCQMPIFRYFMFVGGALLTLLLGVNLVMPQPGAVEATAVVSSNDAPTIRIRSDRRLPERVVLDTSQPAIAPAVKTAEASKQSAQTEQSQALALADTFAQ